MCVCFASPSASIGPGGKEGSETANDNTIRGFEGGASGAERKIFQKHLFLGKRHDNKISKVLICLSRNLLSLRRLLKVRR